MVALGVGACVGVGVGLDIDIGVGVFACVGVTAGLALGVAVGVALDVSVGVALGVTVGVALGVVLAGVFFLSRPPLWLTSSHDTGILSTTGGVDSSESLTLLTSSRGGTHYQSVHSSGHLVPRRQTKEAVVSVLLDYW